MPREQFTKPLLLAAVAATLCLSQAFALTAPQSGRRTKKDAPAPSKTAPQPASPQTTAADGAQPDESATRIRSLIIVGNDTDSEYKILTSKHPEMLAKFCEERLKEERVRAALSWGGRIGRAKAIELAKREQDAHVLWFEFMTRGTARIADRIDRVDYFILAPRTAEMIFTGQIRLKHDTMPRGGPLPRIPGVRTNVRPIEIQLRDAGRELAERIKDKL